MKNDPTRYQQYGLEPKHFNVIEFEQNLGERLSAHGYDNVCRQLIIEGSHRLFTNGSLTAQQQELINKEEALNAAMDAEVFQHKVSQTDIQENFDSMVDLRATAPGQSFDWTFSKTPYHDACGEWAGKERMFWVRKTIASQLYELASKLHGIDLRMHFEDGFRPLGVQEGLFRRRIAMARTLNATWSDEELILEAKSKTAYTPRLAAHKAGAAVDLRLVDIQTNSFLDIGHEYPDGGEIVRLNTDFISQRQWQNRKVLEALASTVGLSMYPYEDWHLSSLDATAAVVNNENGPYVAKYGPIKHFSRETGEITEIYDQEELDTIFDLS